MFSLLKMIVIFDIFLKDIFNTNIIGVLDITVAEELATKQIEINPTLAFFIFRSSSITMLAKLYFALCLETTYWKIAFRNKR